MVEPVLQQTLHRLFKCSDGRETLAIKLLTARPDLPGWRDKFYYTFEIESELARNYSFLPEPRQSLMGPIYSSKNGIDCFIAHAWMHGSLALGNQLPMVQSELGKVIAATAKLDPRRSANRLNADDPVPSVSDVLRHLAEALPDYVDDYQTLYAAKPFLERILIAPRPVSDVLGHRDLSPKNVLVKDIGCVAVVDWENAGMTHLTQEVGRILATWDIAVEQISAATQDLLGDALLPDSNNPQRFWFREWLEGHLMFMEYLWRCGAPARPVYKGQMQQLCSFVTKFEAMIG